MATQAAALFMGSCSGHGTGSGSTHHPGLGGGTLPGCIKPPKDPKIKQKSVKLMDFIEAIENKLGTTAQKNMMDMQPGDVERTWANVVPLISDYDYTPNTPIQEGVDSFIDWYRR